MKNVQMRFGDVDYIIFSAMLILSALTGVYFGFKNKITKKKSDTLKEYLTGNRNLKAFPVAMSLVASYISGVTILGTPSEIYNYGGQYWLIIFSMALSGLTVATVYLPVFTKLQVCSSYEYLELRFSKTLRTITSLFFLLDEIMFIPMLLYVPSLAFNQVSGANIYMVGVIVCLICIFYTILGGIKAVVYTDTWQTVVMFISVIVVVVLGVISVGGFGVIIDRAIDGGRITVPDFRPSMYKRFNAYSVLIGGYTYWTSFNSVNQTMVQRYLSLPTDKKSKLSVFIFTVGVIIFISLCCFSGILVYSTYHDCDPLSAKLISKDDQLLPFFVLDTAGHLKGVSGLFIAGVFGAALSSLSVVLNSTSVVLLEDFFRGLCHVNITERSGKIITRCIITLLGIVAIGMIFVVEHMGSVFEVASSLSAIVAGTMFGVFSLGMLVPWSNNTGAIAGAVGGFLMSGLVSYGSQFAVATKRVVSHRLPVSVEKCQEIYGLNATLSSLVYPDESEVFPLFRLSYLWITPIGFSTVMFVGIITSFLTGFTDLKTLDPELVSPVSKWLLPAEAQDYAGSAVRSIKHQRLMGDVSDANLLVAGNVGLSELVDRDNR